MSDKHKVVLTFELPLSIIKTSGDLKENTAGITTESVAAWLCGKHDPRDGYINFRVVDDTPFPCPECDGKGITDDGTCLFCDGAKMMRRT